MSTTPNHVVDRIEKPYYYHHYPVFKRVKLPAVKHGIYNPHLPTLRHMDRDTVACKLPDEHCQSTNCCNPRDFALAELTGVSKSQKWHSCPDDTKTERTVSRLYFKTGGSREADG
ncbi:testis, prostate and placenta-expressed protein-like [Physella acuta]|uniref:testis, prostate and placenta-expressed protein-like n=1 Tax=Physella acuta TaxID=109671 RepID=UPI0027DCA81A|nr:testis, prostate and placenta-expressed protein-like [Physella acuta]XP_059139279.1 testis, prostate and placenta-expressed protein-like [Physella acuta]